MSLKDIFSRRKKNDTTGEDSFYTGIELPSNEVVKKLKSFHILIYIVIVIVIVVISLVVLSFTHVIRVFAPVSSTQQTEFIETGLPAGMNWSVKYNGITKYSTTSTMYFSTVSENFGYIVYNISNYTVGCGVVYNPSPSTGIVKGGSKVSISFSLVKNECRTTFNASGLPSGSFWTVRYANLTKSSSNNSISFSTKKLVGGYNISTIFNSSSKCNIFVPTPSNGTINAGKEISIKYTNTTICNNTLTYFNETGLPKGINWSVTYDKIINYSNTSSIKFLTRPGKFFYLASSIRLSKPYCIGYIPKPSNGTLQAGLSVLINYTNISTCNYTTTYFNETGLPIGMKWSVTYDGVVNSSNTSSINISTLKGNYSMIVSSPYNITGRCKTVYNPNIKYGYSIAGKTVKITYNSSLYCMTYFNETGLPPDTNWVVKYNNVTNSSSSTTVGFLAISGTHSYTISSVIKSQNGCTITYLPSPSSGNAPYNSTIPISFSISKSMCPTYFVENNLLAGANWSVEYSGLNKSSTFSTISFYVPNGTYAYSVGNATARTAVCNYSYVPSPASGKAAYNSTVSISFSVSKETCITTFTESGLPTGLNWSVSYNGVNKSSNLSSISFLDLNGSYTYSVSSPKIITSNCNTTYSPSPQNGTAATGTSISISYTSNVKCKVYTTTFYETGLPKGTNWSATYNGKTNFSNSTSMAFYDLAGNYSYNLSSTSSNVSGCTPAVYSPNPGSGYITAGSSITINYSSPGVVCTTRFTAYGLPNWAFWNVTYNGATESSTNNTVIFKESHPFVYNYSVPTQLYYAQKNYCQINSYHLSNSSYGSAQAGTNVSIGFLNSSGCTVAYVADYGSSNVSIINTTSNSVVNISVGKDPYSLSISPNGELAYLGSFGESEIEIINTSSKKIIRNITGLSFPIGLAITPNGKLAYVDLIDGNTVPVINLSSDSVIYNVKGVSSPYGIAITPNGKLAYVASRGSDTVSVINISSNIIIKNITNLDYPSSVAITPNGKLAYVADEDSNQVSVINTSSNTVIDNITGFASPDSIAITPNGKLAYVANYAVSSDSVYVINISSNNIISSIGVGYEPEAIAITPNGKLAYVTNHGGTVSIINISSNSLINNIPIVSKPIGISTSILDSI